MNCRAMEFSELDRKIISRLSGDLPSDKAPFATIVRKLGVDEAELLEKIKSYAESGVLRRFGAVLAHRSAGFVANALVAWRVPEDKVTEAAQVMTEFQEVSHCYERPAYPQWPYNVYTMIHGRDREECLELIQEISSRAGVRDYKVLFTAREFKKESMRYFDS